MKFCFILLLSCLWLFSGCSSQIDIAAERTALLETDKEFSSLSARAGAAKAFYQYLDSAAIQITESEGVIHGRDKIFERMKPLDPAYSLLWEPKFADVSQSGDMGWTWGTYTVHSKTDSAQAQGNYLNVWTKKPDGTWRVVADIGNVVRE